MKRVFYLLFAAIFFAGSMHAQTPTMSRRQAAGRSMEQQGLVNIKHVVPSIACAEALRKAQAELKRRRPDLSLCIFDATRPMSIQQTMWDAVKDTPKYFYVSNPAHGGGMHNYGMAVDISICKASWNDATWRDGATRCLIDTIPMGVKVDHMGIASHIDKENDLVARRLISREALANRRLLREVMSAAGFMPLRTEWWHFNLCTRAWAKQNLRVVR